MGKAASAKSIQAHSFRSNPEPDRITRAGTIDDVCFGSLAVVRDNISLMSAFGGKADIGYETGRQEKARHKTGLSISW